MIGLKDVKNITRKFGFFSFILGSYVTLISALINKIPENYILYIAGISIIIFFFLAIYLINKTDDGAAEKTSLKTDDGAAEKTSLKIVPDLKHVTSCILKQIRKKASNNSNIYIDNLGLDLISTSEWFESFVIPDDSIKKLKYRILVIGNPSGLMERLTSENGNPHHIISHTAAKKGVQRFYDAIKANQNILISRKIEIEIKTYEFPPIVHGFLINKDFLYFSFTNIQNRLISFRNDPYLYLNNIKNIERFHEYFFYKVYRSWFEWSWTDTSAKRLLKFPYNNREGIYYSDGH